MTIDELVGENLRRAREAVGVSRRDLAQRATAIGLPLTEADLLGLETGSTAISVDELVALGLALGVPPGLLLAPLNLGSLLCVDGEGRATASWSLFHDWARPFSPPSKPGALPAAPAEAASETPAEAPAARPPESEPVPPSAPPTRADDPVPPPPATAAPPSPATPGPPPPLPQEPAGHQAPTAPPPSPRPAPEPSPPRPTERPPDRDWALQALRDIHQAR